VHDYFDILGVSRNARPTEVRRACCGRTRATHPDVRDGEPPARAGASAFGLTAAADLAPDAAIDFVDASAFIDAMRSAFFRNASSS
jgi:hypothetical protein